MRALIEALVGYVVLGIPFLAFWWGGMYVIYRIMGASKAGVIEKPGMAFQLVTVVWTFVGVALGIRLIEMISAATGIK